MANITFVGLAALEARFDTAARLMPLTVDAVMESAAILAVNSIQNAMVPGNLLYEGDLRDSVGFTKNGEGEVEIGWGPHYRDGVPVWAEQGSGAWPLDGARTTFLIRNNFQLMAENVRSSVERLMKTML